MRPTAPTDLIDYPDGERGAILKALAELTKRTKGQYKHVVASLQDSSSKRGGRILGMTDIEHALTQAAYSRSKAQGIPRRLFNQLLPHAVL
jgi:hypothetical protein